MSHGLDHHPGRMDEVSSVARTTTTTNRATLAAMAAMAAVCLPQGEHEAAMC